MEARVLTRAPFLRRTAIVVLARNAAYHHDRRPFTRRRAGSTLPGGVTGDRAIVRRLYYRRIYVPPASSSL
jgi:hypothetical protein